MLMNRFGFSIIVLTTAAFASADTFLYQGMAPNHGTAKIHLSGSVGSYDGNVYIGENKFTYGSEPQTYGYCVDILHAAGNGQAFKSDTGSLNGGATIGYLLQKYAPTFHDNVDKKGSAALQLAIWDILYEAPTGNIQATTAYSINLNAGNFKADTIKVDGSTFDPSTYFAMFNADLGGSAITTRFEGHTGTSMQSFASAAPVPEPATLAALAVGAVGLLRRRKR